MKRTLIAFFACVMCMLTGLSFAHSAQAAPMLVADATVAPDAFMELKSKIVPELEKILTPEQKTQFEDAVSNGTNLKKAFKSITLTPEQKSKVGMMLKSVPKDYFSSLSPTQKRDLFMQKGEYFMEQGKAKAEAAMKAARKTVENVKEAVMD
jgi:Spy/CpxP family protein refolding chaperone